MNIEQLNKGNKIAKEIERCKVNIHRVGYTQSDSVVIRESYWKFNGTDESIEVPDSLFRIIGKLILAEYQQKLIELEKEFDGI